jgi:hypothetical protein
MKIENIAAARVNLSGYALPEFYIIAIPGAGGVVDCYMGAEDYGNLFHMFGIAESVEAAARIAYVNVPEYLPLFMAELDEE